MPLKARAPDQSPLAVHDEGLLIVVQDNVTDDPGATGPTGLMLNDTTGISGGSSVADTVTVANPDPALFSQFNVNVYVLTVVNAPVLVLPVADWLPVQLPEAVHDDGLLETSQVNVLSCPTYTEVGFAAKCTVGRVAALPVPPC